MLFKEVHLALLKTDTELDFRVARDGELESKKGDLIMSLRNDKWGVRQLLMSPDEAEAVIKKMQEVIQQARLTA